MARGPSTAMSKVQRGEVPIGFDRRRGLLRLTLKNSFVVVYVKRKQWRFPLLLPISLPLLQELLRALKTILWLIGGATGDRGWCVLRAGGDALRRQRWLLQEQSSLLVNFLSDGRGSALSAWPEEEAGKRGRWLVVMERALEDLRRLGPFCLVRAETAEVKVVVRLI